MGRFDLIACDFQSHYGLDLSDLRHKSGHWFRRFTVGLLQEDTRLYRALHPAEKQPQEVSE